jgi:cytochrome oxidase Cu insertion factor (SCO1/SenC/PrrC family)
VTQKQFPSCTEKSLKRFHPKIQFLKTSQEELATDKEVKRYVRTTKRTKQENNTTVNESSITKDSLFLFTADWKILKTMSQNETRLKINIPHI